MKLEITLQEKISSLNALCLMVARTISDFGAYLNMIALSTYVYFIPSMLEYFWLVELRAV